MSVLSLLALLRASDIKLHLDDGKLKVNAPKGALNAELLARIKADKAQLIDALHEMRGAQDIKPVPRDGRRLPLSYAQQRLWFLDQLQGAGATYNMPVALRFRGVLDVDNLRRSFHLLLRRQEILRARFAVSDGEPDMLIGASCDLPLPLVASDEAELEQRLRRHALMLFDLQSGPLLDAQLLRLDEHDHVLLFNIHHIIADGWSLGVLLQDWIGIYAALQRGVEPPAALPVQYADYAHWQRDAAQTARVAKHLEYWKQQLAHAPELLDLPLDRPRPPVQRFDGGSVEACIDAALTERLRQFGAHTGATSFMMLIATFAALLARYSGQTDILVGTPHVNRDRPELEGLVGLFLDTLVLRADLSGTPSFRTLVDRMRKTALDAYAHADVPFERVVDALPLQRDLSRNPLFQVFFNMLNLPHIDGQVAGLQVEELATPDAEAKFDLTLYARESADGLRLRLVYNANLFECERMHELLRQFAQLLERAVAAPDLPLGEHDLVTAAARNILPDPTLPLDDTWRGSVPEVFAAHVARAPDAPALASHDGHWSYRELDQHSDRIALYLQAHGIGLGDVVAICAARCKTLPAAVLGTMKSGATLMLLDPAYPPEQLNTRLRVVPAQAWLQIASATDDGLEHLRAACRVCLDLSAGTDTPALLALADRPCKPTRVGAEDIALITFTSGSTGIPKAVEGRHGPLTHYLPWVLAEFGFDSHDRWTLLSGLAHDPLQRDIFTPLCTGGCLCIPHPQQILDGKLAAWFEAERITMTNLTPAMAQVLSEAPAEMRLMRLRRAILVGDVLTRRDVRRLQKLAPALRIASFYGSTETQRAVAYHDTASAAHSAREVIPLGRGIRDVQLVVINAAGRQAGIGEHGEVYLRSPQLARGYRGDAEQTALRFLRNPFTDDARDRMYRTGDLGRYLPDGAVEFRGRADTQVKLRGFRIELGEIESLLGRHPGVREAIVALHGQDADKRLIAYVTCATQRPSAAQLREHLRAQLPEYMLPSAFVFLDRLPLTPNGKVDRRALPAPALEHGTTHVPAQTPTEQRLGAIWADLLKLERIGRHDNFFELGGHSLLTIRLLTRVREAFDVELAVRVVFESPTLAEMALAVQRAHVATWSPLVRMHTGTADRAPLFLVHALGGGVQPYADLVRALGSELTVYGLQARGLEGTHAPLARIEDMAACYLEAMQTVQPQGPYTLIGYSLGGPIALEIAIQLQARGERVDFLGLLDSRPPDGSWQAPASRAQLLADVWGEQLGFVARDLASLDDDAQARFVLERAIAAGKVPAGFGLLEAQRQIRVIEAAVQAIVVYRSTAYAGPAVVFRALASKSVADGAGWRRCIAAPLQIIDVPGDHASVLLPPHVQTLAARVCAALDRRAGACSAGPLGASDLAGQCA